MRRHVIGLLLAVLCQASAPLSAQQTGPAVDWDALSRETVKLLQEYVRINTTNPPGNEIQTARYLKKILEQNGIEAQILDTAELQPAGRANLYARLKGNGSKKAIA